MGASHPETGGTPIRILVDLRAYDIDAVKSAAYEFINTHNITISLLDEHTAEVLFSSIDPDNPRLLEGEFLNQVLDWSIRNRLRAETASLRRLIITHALSETSLLGSTYNDASPEEDPLGILTNPQRPPDK